MNKSNPLNKYLCLLAVALAGLLAGCAGSGSTGKGGQQLVLADDGQSEIEVTGAWETRPNMSARAQIRLANTAQDQYLVINTYAPEKTGQSSLEDFAQELSGAIFENLGKGRVSEARALKIGGLPAVEYQMRTGGKDGIVYVSTVVQGQRARYHLLGWTDANRDLSALHRTFDGFRESSAARPARERVVVKFNWPDSMKSHSSVQLKVNKRGEQYEMQGDMETSVRRASPEELRVSTKVLRSKFAFGGSAGKDKAKEEFLQSVVRASLTEVPDYVVNGDGELVRLENLQAYVRRMQDAIVKGLPTSGGREAQARAREFVESALTEEALMSSIQEDWAEVVGNWAGGAYVIGQAYVYTVDYQAPQISDTPFPMEVTQQLTGYVPCKAGAAPQSCVRLLQTSRVRGRDYTRAMDAYVRKTVGNGVRVEDMEVVNTVELITDPRTLLPRSSKTKETKRVTINVDGKTAVNEEIKDESVSYRY